MAQRRNRSLVTAGGKAKSPVTADVSQPELAQQLATFLQQGVPLLAALERLSAGQKSDTLKSALMEVRGQVRAGVALSVAMRQQRSVFASGLVDWVTSGEVKGDLQGALREFAAAPETSAPTGANTSTGQPIDGLELLTLEQAVQFLGTSKPTMHRLLRQGDIKGLKVGRQWRFRRADLVAHMERKPTGVAATATPALDAEVAHFQSLFDHAGNGAVDENEGDKIVRLVNYLLMTALREGASDIHLEPQRGHLLVRNRVDGVLHEVRQIPQALTDPLIQRLKVMGDMDIAEKRIPQDGRIHIKHGERNYDLRTSTMPTAYGEAVTMRILDQSSMVLSQERLGLAPEVWQTIEGWIHRPNGIILVTGPIGSGKTTVAYCLLQAGTGPGKKTMTVEDPVEYLLPGMTQTHVVRRVNLTFASALRAMLRHDPDVLMIGELPDRETCEVACQAALTGHLVLSTLHTNSAPATLSRLLDLGIEPFIIASSLIGITAQRLARRICPDCAAPAKVDDALLERIAKRSAAEGYLVPRTARFNKGKGCPKCRQTGYKGRLALLQTMPMSAELAAALLRHGSEHEFAEIAYGAGMKSLLAVGIEQAVAGATTVDEVLRVVTLPMA